MRTNLITLFIACLVFIAGTQSCDVAGEESYDFEPGDSLTVVGPASVNLPQDTTTADPTDYLSASASYYSRNFTINKEYAWTVSEGVQQDSVYRQGEYIDVTYTQPGTYSISVDDGEYQGSIDVTVEIAPADE